MRIVLGCLLSEAAVSGIPSMTDTARFVYSIPDEQLDAVLKRQVPEIGKCQRSLSYT